MANLRRLRRIIKDDGRAFIVAMDHGTNAGAVEGLEDPSKAIEKVKAGGADAIIANLGLAENHVEELAGMGLILRVDISPTMIGEGHESRLIFNVEQALRVGADAVIINGGPGVGVEEKTLPNIAKIVEQCKKWNLPVVGEMSPGGFDSDPELRTLENVVLGARIASELGVDLIKTMYKPGFEKVVEGSFAPVVVLGGAKTDDKKKFLASIKDAVDNGAAGVAIGRNVWKAEKPYNMARALASIIHEDAEVDEAVNILNN